MTSTDNNLLVAIVTGAASGIGLEITKSLLSRNYRVEMIDLNVEAGERESKNFGPNTAFTRGDSSNWEELSNIFKTVKERYGRIDLFAANAGIGRETPSLYGSPSDTEPVKPGTLILDINLTGVIYGANLAIFYMRQNPVKGGKIVVTASATGLHAVPSSPLYTASKHGVSAHDIFYYYCFWEESVSHHLSQMKVPGAIIRKIADL